MVWEEKITCETMVQDYIIMALGLHVQALISHDTLLNFYTPSFLSLLMHWYT